MKIFKYALLLLAALILLTGAVFYFKVRIEAPVVAEDSTNGLSLQKNSEANFQFGNNLLKKNKSGIWEMYLEGKAYERGVAFGILGEQLMGEKEAAFIGEIKNRIPSETYLNFLKYLVGWFNRDLDTYVPREHLLEIYGSSKLMSDNFDFIAPKFHRALSYHAAHDIGHALQNMNLVGCTSFATWGAASKDDKLLIGRNFDFYFGEKFAQDKVIAFYRPDSGYAFASVTWAGFSGVVSGMNEKGLTVTLNSAKSEIPTKGKTPVSIIAREILQYASTIQEAYEIAGSFDSFVAETFLIGSKADGKVGLIEKTPDRTALYFSDTNQMVITNHFQSEELINTPLNQEYMREEVSTYRYKRVEELLREKGPLDPQLTAEILRDKEGLGNANIGLGNEKAINQLLAHHAVIFSPDDLLIWVSTPPYQLGDFLAYDLKEIFSGDTENMLIQAVDSLTIPADPFLQTRTYEQFEIFARLRDRIQHFLFTGKGELLSPAEVAEFEKSNPDSFLTYYYLGDYFKKQEDWEKSLYYFEQGLQKEIARVSERKHMQAGVEACKAALAKNS